MERRELSDVLGLQLPVWAIASVGGKYELEDRGEAQFDHELGVRLWD